jgi:hypothetical protein
MQKSDYTKARQNECYICALPNEILERIFWHLRLKETIYLPPLAVRESNARDPDSQTRATNNSKRLIAHAQITVLSWVSSQFRRVVHEHPIWSYHLNLQRFHQARLLRLYHDGTNSTIQINRPPDLDLRSVLCRRRVSL